eukprot:GHVP01034924.1.p1 GENE.GHVP01034924.1~~GHVP01034924.1.p1  ORF type:complete len:433 (-),score=54.76 GHVP01034924.1:1293-2591(-)
MKTAYHWIYVFQFVIAQIEVPYLPLIRVQPGQYFPIDISPEGFDHSGLDSTFKNQTLLVTVVVDTRKRNWRKMLSKDLTSSCIYFVPPYAYSTIEDTLSENLVDTQDSCGTFLQELELKTDQERNFFMRCNPKFRSLDSNPILASDEYFKTGLLPPIESLTNFLVFSLRNEFIAEVKKTTGTWKICYNHKFPQLDDILDNRPALFVQPWKIGVISPFEGPRYAALVGKNSEVSIVEFTVRNFLWPGWDFSFDVEVDKFPETSFVSLHLGSCDAFTSAFQIAYPHSIQQASDSHQQFRVHFTGGPIDMPVFYRLFRRENSNARHYKFVDGVPQLESLDGNYLSAFDDTDAAVGFGAQKSHYYKKTRHQQPVKLSLCYFSSHNSKGVQIGQISMMLDSRDPLQILLLSMVFLLIVPLLSCTCVGCHSIRQKDLW